MGRVIRTFITAVDVLGERISALPQRLPTAAKERWQGHGCLPVPFRPTQRLTAPNGGGIVRGSMTEKKWLLLCQRRIKIQQAAESPWPGSARFLLSDLRPSGRKSGCGRQPAKSVWLPAVSQTLCLPHPWVGKTAFPGRASTGGTSALRTARRCGMVFPALFSTVHFSLIGGANRSGLVAQTGRGWEPGQRASAGLTAPTRPCSAPPGLRMPSCLQGGTQGRTGGSRRRIGVSDSRGAEPFSLYCISKSDRTGRFWQTVPPTEIYRRYLSAPPEKFLWNF